MKVYLLPIYPLIVAMAAGLISCATKNSQEQKPQDIGGYISSYIQKYNIPGASIAVSKDGKIIYTKGVGFADVEAQMEPSEITLFRIASVSKPITAVALFKVLEDQGIDMQAALNKPVFGPQGYLPKYKHIKDKRVYKITLRDLLQHTGGWKPKDDYDPQYDVYHIAKKMGVKVPAGHDEVIRYVLKYQKLDLAPGKEFHYSNLGYNIIARVIEKLSKEPYEKYVQEHIFAPLGITDMQIAGNTLADRESNEARYYDDPRSALTVSVFDNKTKGHQSYNGFAFETMDGHGGWIATPTDLVKFLIALTPSLGGVQLLKPETLKIMTTPSKTIENPPGKFTVALGWNSLEDGKNISHAGALETGTLSYLVRRSDGVTWAVIFNRLPIQKVEEIGPMLKDLVDHMNELLK